MSVSKSGSNKKASSFPEEIDDFEVLEAGDVVEAYYANKMLSGVSELAASIGSNPLVHDTTTWVPTPTLLPDLVCGFSKTYTARLKFPSDASNSNTPTVSVTLPAGLFTLTSPAGSNPDATLMVFFGNDISHLTSSFEFTSAPRAAELLSFEFIFDSTTNVSGVNLSFDMSWGYQNVDLFGVLTVIELPF